MQNLGTSDKHNNFHQRLREVYDQRKVIKFEFVSNNLVLIENRYKAKVKFIRDIEHPQNLHWKLVKVSSKGQ